MTDTNTEMREALWSQARSLFVRHAGRFMNATRYEVASAIADEAAREIEALFSRQPADTGEGIQSDAATIEGLKWKPMDTAPRDRMIIAMARYPLASAGAPAFVGWGGALGWCEFSRHAPEPMVCWAWIDRDVLPAWPNESQARSLIPDGEPK